MFLSRRLTYVCAVEGPDVQSSYYVLPLFICPQAYLTVTLRVSSYSCYYIFVLMLTEEQHE
jgi:hypothetical protein